MGDPRKLRKKYTPPKHPWESERLAEEKKIVESFGLKNKKEIWRADSTIRKFRYLARGLVGIPINQRKGEEEKLLSKLQKLGLLKESATLDDALSLKTEDLLARRLQTLVWRKGLATTLTQARQFITHGHISVNKRRVDAPGVMIGNEAETGIDWYGKPMEIAKKPEVAPVVPEKKEEPKKEGAPVEKKPKAKRAPRKPTKKVAEAKEIKEELEGAEEIPEVGEGLNAG
jgi:small subunit ribosomal protein S4